MPEFITVIKAISNEYVIEIKNIARLGGRVKKHQKPRRKEKATEHKIPDDFILATGKSITVREFANKVFKKLNLDLIWRGKKENEKGLCKKTGKILIEIDKKYYRPNEVNFLQGNAKKAKQILKWRPLIKLDKMIDDMINFKLKD